MLAKGFTLIELMVVVAIVAILAAVAVPSYQSFVQDGRRAECKAFALDVASRQERNWTQNSTYFAIATAANATAFGLPNGLSSENGFCTVASTGGNSFTITVTSNPVDTQCAGLTLTNTGVKDSTNATLSDAEVAECWR